MPFQILPGSRPVQGASSPGKKAENIHDGWNFIIEHTVQRLAAVERLQLSKCSGIVCDGIRQFKQELRSHFRRCLSPCCKRMVRSANGGINLRSRRLRNFQDKLSGRRVVNWLLFTFTATSSPLISNKCCIAISHIVVYLPFPARVSPSRVSHQAPKIGSVVTSMTSNATTLVTGTSRGRPN